MQVTLNGVVQGGTANVWDVVYLNSTIYYQDNTYNWHTLQSVSGNTATWSAATTTSPITSWASTRNYWDHPGGNGSVWNTPFGSGAIFGAATDADSIALHSVGGNVNTAANFGQVTWVSLSASDGTASFTGTGLDYANPSFPGSGTPAATTAHLVQGSYSAGPYPNGDCHYIFFDNINSPGKQWDFFGLPNLQSFLNGQGPFNAAFGGSDNAIGNLYGMDWQTGLNSPCDGTGAIRGYDLDPARNPARIPGTNLTRIQHVIHYALPSAVLKPNAQSAASGNNNYPNGILNPNSWPRLYQDYQSGVNVYSGTAFVYGTTIGIPQNTPRPSNLHDAGIQLWDAFQNYGGINADQAGEFAIGVDQTVSASWASQATTDLAIIIPYLLPLRNQHQGNQSFATNPMQGPGARVDTGPRPLAQAPAISPDHTTVSGTSGSIVDANGVVWAINSSQQVTVDGIPDTTTSGVVQIAYVNTLLWKETSAGLWQSKTYPSDNWLPVGGTMTSPLVGFTRTPAGILAYFSNIQGKHTISGQFVELQSAGFNAIASIANTTGKTVGVIGGDYWHFGGTGAAVAGYPFNAFAINAWNNGGLITLILSMPNPTTGGYSGDTSALNAADLLTTGTATNNVLQQYLQQVATGLLQLQAAGVVVMLRPWHEANGNWFWWGTEFLTDAQFVALWKYTYDYFVTKSGLSNLLWVFSMNIGVTSSYPINGRYPGSSYVDIVGIDVYTSNPSIAQADYNLMLTYGKPFAFCEFGSGSPSGADTTFNEETLVTAFKNTMPNTVWFQQWWDVWGIQNMQNITTALNDPWIYNLNDLNNAITPPVVPSPNGTVVLPGSGNTITGVAGHVWSLTAGAQVAVNGAIDTTTANVVELAYVNHTIYQKNAAGLWYGKSRASQAWGPGTTTSPLTGTAQPVAQPAAAGTGNFQTINGQIIDPNGNVFIAHGVNVYDQYMSNAVSNSTTGAPLTTLLKGINFVRLNAYSYDPPATYSAFINTLTALGIVVEIEHHSGAGGGVPPLSGADLVAENNWFGALAAAFKQNPYVWFGTLNEPSGPGTTLTAEQVSNYNTIRAAGNNSIIMFQILADYSTGVQVIGAGAGLISASYLPMKNVVWDFHWYNYVTGNSTDFNTIKTALLKYIAQAQTIPSGNGTMPVIIGEFGPSTNGSTDDPGGYILVDATCQSGYGYAAWNWLPNAPADNVTNGGVSLTTFGTQLAAYIAAAAPPAPPLTPTPTPTESPNNTVVLEGSGASITDAFGEVFTIVGNTQVVVDGVTDTTTANVIELAYVNSVVWHENASALWYSKSVPSDTWSPATGTTVNPLTSTPTPTPTPTPPMVPSPNGTIVLAGQTNTIIGIDLSTWGINQAGQVVVNGIADTTTSTVTELAYVSSRVYYETSTGLWRSKSIPSDTWIPSAGTTTSPFGSTPTPTPTPTPPPAIITIGTIPNQTASAPFTISGTYTVTPTTFIDKLIYEDNNGVMVPITSPPITLKTSNWSIPHAALPAGTHTVTIKDPITGVVAVSNVFTVGGVSQAINAIAPSGTIVAETEFTFSGTLTSFATAPSLTYSIQGGPKLALGGVTSTGWSTQLVVPTAGTYTIQVFSNAAASNVVTVTVAPQSSTFVIRPNPPVPVVINYPFYDTFTSLADVTDTGSAAISGLIQITASPPGQSFVDNLGYTWTIVGGVVLQNGTAAGYSANVIAMAFVNNVVWQENSSNLWYYWTQSNLSWAAGANPLTPANYGSWMNHFPFGGQEYTIFVNSEAEYYTSNTRTPPYSPFALQNGGVGPGLSIAVDTAAATPYYPAHTPANALLLPYNSGLISSCTETNGLPAQGLYSFTYGLVEIQALMPGGPGMWPQIGLSPIGLPAGSGTIDVVQTGGMNNTTIYGSIGSPTGSQQFTTSVLDFTQNRHTYAVNWTATTIDWYVDGIQYGTYPTPPAFVNQPCYISIALAVQGSPNIGPSGIPNASTVFPSYMLIDFVRVSQPSSGNVIGAGDLLNFSGSLTNYPIPPSLSYSISGSNNAQTPITGVTAAGWNMQIHAPNVPGNYAITVTDGTFAASTDFTVAGANVSITPIAPNAPVAGNSFTFTGILQGYATIPALTLSINGGPAIPIPSVSVTGWSATAEIDTVGSNTIVVSDGTNIGSVTFNVSGSIGTQVTWNPSDLTGVALSNNNYTATATGSATPDTIPQGVRANAPITGSFVIWETTFSTITQNCSVGVSNAAFLLNNPGGLGTDALGIGFYPSTGAGSQPPQTVYLNSAQLTAGNGTPSTAPAPVTIVFANNALFFSTDAMRTTPGVTWNNSTTDNPATGSGGFPITGIVAASFYPTFTATEANGVVTLNDGTAAFSSFATAFIAANPTVSTLAQIATPPLRTIVPNTPSSVAQGVGFAFSGSLNNFGTIPPTLVYTISPGGSPAILAGVTATGWSTTLTIGTAGTYTITVTDGTHSGTTGPFSVGVAGPVTIGAIAFVSAFSVQANSAVNTVAGQINVSGVNGSLTGITYTLNTTANFKITSTGQIQFASASVAAGNYPLTVTVTASNATNSPQTFGFSIAVASTTATGYFRVSGGKIFDPAGNFFLPAGINLSDDALGIASTNSSCQPLTTLFPKANIIRVNTFLASGNNGTSNMVYHPPSYYSNFVQQATGYTLNGTTWTKTGNKNILVMFEDHDANMLQAPFTGQALTIQTNWYNAMASFFAGNPYVGFCTQNEMNTGDYTYSQAAFAAMSVSHLAIYNAVRGVGYTSGAPHALVMIMMGAGGSNDGTVGASAGYTLSDYAGMTNIIWELHDSYYSNGEVKTANGSNVTGTTALGWITGAVGPVAGLPAGDGILGAQTIKSADGVVPIIFGEWGSSGGDPSGTNATEIAAALVSVAGTYYAGCTAWQWHASDTQWPLVDYTKNPLALTGWGNVCNGVINSIAKP